MTHSKLEKAIIKYIKKDPIFNCYDLCLSSDEEDGNKEVYAEINGLTESCRPDIKARNFFGDQKFQIYGEAKTSNDFYNLDPDYKKRHNRQMNVMLNALRVKKDKITYLIYACEIDFRSEIEKMLNLKKQEFNAFDVNVIIIDEINNPDLF
tara:strand:- start:1875 stop:2327 length:453 start_codon:yes stop_codon:yes gene_type:complete